MATAHDPHGTALAAPSAPAARRAAAWAGFFAWGFYFEALGAGERSPAR